MENDDTLISQIQKLVNKLVVPKDKSLIKKIKVENVTTSDELQGYGEKYWWLNKVSVSVLTNIENREDPKWEESVVYQVVYDIDEVVKYVITKEFVLVVFFLDKNLELIYDEGLVKARSSIRIMY